MARLVPDFTKMKLRPDRSATVNARCQIGGADPLVRAGPPGPASRTGSVWTGLQEQIHRYTEHFGQPLRLGFADPALATEDLGDPALGQNVPEVAWLQLLLLEQGIQHLVWLGFRQRMHAIQIGRAHV